MKEIVTKQCRKCNDEKDISAFHKDKRQADGYQRWCIDCMRDYRADYMSRPDVRQRENRNNSDRQLHYNYGISIDEYERLFREQNGKCAVCGRKSSRRRLHVDHDHKTGAVRGLLCGSCNVALGHVGDSVSVLQRLIDYLTK